MSCNIEEFVKYVVNNSSSKVALQLQAILNENNTGLGSEEYYGAMGGANIENERAYWRTRKPTVSQEIVLNGAKSELNSDKPMIKNTPIEITSVTYVDDEVKVYYKTKYSKKILFTSPILIRLNQKNAVDIIDKYVATQTDLGNTQQGKAPKAEPMDLRPNVFESTTSMKALVQELKDLSADTIPQEYVDYVSKLIDSIHPDMLPKLDLYVKTKAAESKGFINNKHIIIYNSSLPVTANNQMNGVQVYAHEMMHAISKFTIDTAMNNPMSEAYNVIRQVQRLRKVAKKQIDSKYANEGWKIFLPAISLDLVQETAIAKERYSYVFDSSQSLHEFIAHGLTNPELMNILQNETVGSIKFSPKLLDKLKQLFKTLIELVLGEYNWRDINKSQHQKLMQLTFDLAKYNNKLKANINHKRTLGRLLSDTLNKYGNEPLQKLIDKLSEKLIDSEITPPPGKDEPRLKKIKWLAGYIPKLLFRTDMRGYRETVFQALAISPEGTINNIIGAIEEPGELERLIEQLGIDNKQIDRRRTITVDAVYNLVHEAFNKPLTEVEEEIITYMVMDTDLSVLSDKYTLTDIDTMITDKTVIENYIALELKQLSKLDNTNLNWYKVQAKGLGDYLNTHKRHIAQFLNASNITEAVNNTLPEVIEIVDRLSTLYALQDASIEAKNSLSLLIKNESKGIQNIIDLQKISKEASNHLFINNQNKIKGYSKEIFEEEITIKIDLLSNQRDLSKEGYELVNTLNKNSFDTNMTDMGLYVSKNKSVESYNEHAMRLTGMHGKGTTLSDIANKINTTSRYYQKDLNIKTLTLKRAKIIEDIKKGVITEIVGDNDSLSPITNDAGDITDYRYSMSKYSKKILLEQNTKISDVIGRTIAGIQDKLDTIEQNNNVMKLIEEDMSKNYIPNRKLGKNHKSYIVLGPDIKDPKLSEIYRILPADIKENIKNSPLGYIAVRQGMLHHYFGFRDLSITQLPILSRFHSSEIAKILRIIERIWQEIVAISKVDIVIRTPIVLLQNIVSNLLYSIVNHTNPIEVLKLTLSSFRNTLKYVTQEQQIAKLEIELKLGKPVIGELTRLKNDQKLNPVYELMQAGLYQAIVEDVRRSDFKSSSKFKRKIDDKLKSSPAWIKNGASWLYLDEATKFFQLMTKATQYSDFVARATEYELLLKEGASKKEAQRIVLDAFVNYTRPSSSLEEYLNSMGLIMFTKYAKGIQRAIAKDFKTRPVNALLSLIGQEMFMPLSDIHDQSFLTRNWSNILVNPLDHIERVATPSMLEFVFDV